MALSFSVGKAEEYLERRVCTTNESHAIMFVRVERRGRKTGRVNERLAVCGWWGFCVVGWFSFLLPDTKVLKGLLVQPPPPPA